MPQDAGESKGSFAKHWKLHRALEWAVRGWRAAVNAPSATAGHAFAETDGRSAQNPAHRHDCFSWPSVPDNDTDALSIRCAKVDPREPGDGPLHKGRPAAARMLRLWPGLSVRMGPPCCLNAAGCGCQLGVDNSCPRNRRITRCIETSSRLTHGRSRNLRWL